jgi:hypothetical protein
MKVHVYGWNILFDLTNETLNIYQLVTGHIPKLSCSVKKNKKEAMNLWSCVLTFDIIKFLIFLFENNFLYKKNLIRVRLSDSNTMGNAKKMKLFAL